MNKKIRYISFSIFIFSLIFSIVGFSSWLYFPTNNTGNGVTASGETHNVNIYTRKESNDVSTITQYLIPSSYTVSYDIRPKLVSGSTTEYEKTKINISRSSDTRANSGNVGKSLAGAKENEDELFAYYEFYNNSYTLINQRYNRTIGINDFKTFSFNVNQWNVVENAVGVNYGVIWDYCIKKEETVDGNSNNNDNNYYFKFQGSSGNTISGHGYGKDNCPAKEGDTIASGEYGEAKTYTQDGKEYTDQLYYRIVCRKLEQVIYSDKVSCKLAFFYSTTKYACWYYYPSLEIGLQRTIKSKGNPIDEAFSNKIIVKHNSKIKPIDLKIEDYLTCGFYKDNSYSEFFDFSTPITSDINIYVRHTINSSELTSIINNNTGNTNLFSSINGGSGGDYDISILKDFDSKTNTIFVGKTTIKSGQTVSLTYGNNLVIEGNTYGIDENVSTFTGNDSSPALDYDANTFIGNNNEATHIKLGGDMTINGTLNVGAKIGCNGTTLNSYIIGKYSVLDLYGHTLTIDGGVVNGYGVIKDSIGTGKIIVKNGGKILSVLTATNGSNRDQNVIGLRHRSFPFSEYKFNYLLADTYFFNGTILSAFMRINTSLNISSCYFNVIGPYSSTSSSNALFAWKDSNASSYIIFKNTFINEISTQSTNVLYRYLYYARNKFEFYANLREVDSLTISLSAKVSTFTLNLSVDFARYDFPVSPFFDLVVKKGYTFDLYSKMTFYPGSSFTVENGAHLNFKATGTKSYAKNETSGMGVQAETRYIAGGLMTYNDRIYDISNGYGIKNPNGYIFSNTSYFNYVKFNNIVINGDISFDSSINTAVSTNDGFYYISGEFFLNKNCLDVIINNRNYIKTYDLRGECIGGFLYNNAHVSSDYFYEYVSAYNCLPLICGEKAYILDANNNISGTYNKDSGIFKADTGEKYILRTDTDMHEDGSNSSNNSERIDRNIDILKCNNTYDEYRIVECSGNLYVFYCGIFIPITGKYTQGQMITNQSVISANARKFMSNRDADVTSLITKNTKFIGSSSNEISVSTSDYNIRTNFNAGSPLINSVIKNTSDGSQLAVNQQFNFVTTIELSNSSYGKISVNFDSNLNCTYDTSGIKNGTYLNYSDQISQSKKFVMTIINGDNKFTVTIIFSTSNITITSTVANSSSTTTSKIVSNKDSIYSNCTNSASSAKLDQIQINSNSSGFTYIKSERNSYSIAPLYDDVLLQYNSSTKRWKFYGYSAYPKDASLDVYYTY